LADSQLLLRVLSEFAQTLVRRYEIADVLNDLAERMAAVAEVAAAGVSLVEGDRLRFATGVNQAAVEVEVVQEELQDGPCVESFRSGKVVTVNDLEAVDGRWGRYRDVAREQGFSAVAAIPMIADAGVLGVIDLYAHSPREWTDEDVASARVFADIATSYLINASELADARRTAEQLQEALDSRIVIEQAKGILAADGQANMDAAFEALRRHARAHNASLRSVADAVVNLGLRPQ
jgi:GAF domain-containing protein